MKCPYRDFKECIVEQCPSCNYEIITTETLDGNPPHWMSTDEALKQGCLWHSSKTTYKFKSCKLIDNSVQPVPSNKQIINNTNKTTNAVLIRNSVF